MNYSQATAYLNSFIDYEKLASDAYWGTFKLSRMRKFLEFLGDPHKDLRCVHIAGTKGKGSTCAMLASILSSAGYKTGLYTSPHLVDYRERIQILEANAECGMRNAECKNAGRMIEKASICKLVEKIKPAVQKISKVPKLGPLSFFEAYTALAFLYFKQQKVDIAVLETGLGGRLDATNVVKPLACAITPISLEHTNRLGSTLTEIAGEKAGIIKSSRQSSVVSRQKLTVVTAPQKKEVMGVLQKACKEKKARLLSANILNKVEVSLAGEHQKQNAGVAASLAGVLREEGFSIPLAAVKRGLKNVYWPGRLEIMSRRPLVVLDGAQNAESAAALASSVKKLFSYRKLTLILAVCLQKDIKGIYRSLSPLADRVVLTESKNPRTMPVHRMLKGLLEAKFPEKDITIDMIKNSRGAFKRARETAEKEDLILITGSFYLVGECRAKL